MHSLNVIVQRNNDAAIREYRDAIANDDLQLAARIADALITDLFREGESQEAT